ncbi:hypothetical protein D3C81_1655670 [compost metagenome]
MGVTVEFGARHRFRVGEEAAQAVEALFLILKAFFDAGVTFVGQQLETLTGLLLELIESGPGEQPRENPAGEQYQQRDQPGRDVFTDETQNLWAHGVQRHKDNSHYASIYGKTPLTVCEL